MIEPYHLGFLLGLSFWLQGLQVLQGLDTLGRGLICC